MSAAAAAFATSTSSRPTCATCAAWPRRRPGRRSIARCSAGRSSSSTTTRSATPRPRRRCAAPPPAPASREVEFQYEPIAAAFDHEQGVAREEKVLVADIGGGTSDFSLVRVGPERMARIDRKGDILANHGVHIAGTDFDRRVELATILPLFGYGAYGPEIDGAPAREVPSGVYFDLATWHLINTVYNPQRVVELRGMRSFYADPAQHRRLMTVVSEHLGHDLVARAEGAKIAVAAGGTATIALDHVEPGLAAELAEADALARPRRRPRAHRRRGASDGGAGRSSGRRDRCALSHRRLDRARHAERTAAPGVPGRAAGSRRSLRQRRHRPGAVRAATLRRPAAALTRRRAQQAQPASTAAIACAVGSTLPRFRPATHIRPERTR